MKKLDATRLTAAVLTQQDARIQKLETAIPASVSAQVETARAALAAQIETATATALAALGDQVQGERVKLSAERDRSLLELRALAEGEVIRRFATLEPAPAGPKGDGFRWRGSWDRDTKYAANDVVFARGSSWVAVRPSQGVLPTDSSTDWDRMASAGSTGADGVNGEVTEAQLTAALGALKASDIVDNSEIVAGNVALALTQLDDNATTFAGLAYQTRVIAGSQAAVLNRIHTVTATATLTDPTPSEGATYIVHVRNGTATVGGTDYTAGALVVRTYHSGAWSNTPYATVASVTAINPAIAAGTSAADFTANGRFTLTISGTVTFTGVNYTAGVSELYYLTASGGPHTLNFPSDWVFLTPKPTAIASGKRACLLLDSLTTAATGVRAFYTEES